MRAKTRGRRRRLDETVGLYYRCEGKETARIELLIDNILDGWPLWLLHRRFLLDLVVGRVLFHEIGHHIQAEVEPRRGVADEIADLWRDKLLRAYLRSQYPLLLPLALLVERLTRWLRTANG